MGSANAASARQLRRCSLNLTRESMRGEFRAYVKAAKGRTEKTREWANWV